MKKIRIGVVGTGGISHSHMIGYQKLCDEGVVELVAACDINKERAKIWAEKFGFAEVYGDHKEMLAKSDLDAISVCTWNNSHAPISIDALNAGVHVLCEKPPAMNTKQTIEMKAAEEKSGKTLMLGFVRRFNSNARLIKDFAAKGFFGEFNYSKIAVTRRCGCPLGWFANKELAGGGPLIDNGVHLIDMVRYLTGNPKPVSCYAATYDNIGSRTHIKGVKFYESADPSDFNDVEDLAVGIVRFDTGMTLALEFSYSQEISEDVISVELYGSKGGAVMEPDLKLMTEMNGYLVDITPNLIISGWEEIFENEVRSFVNVIKGNEQNRNTIDDGIELMRIIDALYESAALKREVLIK